MGNSDRQIALHFMQRTFDNGRNGLLAELPNVEKDAEAPHPFKIYQETSHYSLEQTPPLTIGDVRWSFPAFRGLSQYPRGSDSLNLRSLSALLYYTYGFSRHDRGSNVHWPFHRFVPSARCLFPAELYLWIPQTAHIPAGIYHYDPLHHRLAQLRQGEYRPLLSQIVGAELAESKAILLVSSLFWKNAFFYRNFSYRLCSQEAGLLIGNALLVAAAFGLQGHVHYQFLDRPAHRLLGFEPGEESLMAALPLSPWHETGEQGIQPLPDEATETGLLERMTPVAPVYLHVGSLDRQSCRALLELEHHSLLETTAQFARERAGEAFVCSQAEQRLMPPPISTAPLELTQALHRRNSGDTNFTPLALPLNQHGFWEILRYALSPYSNDLKLPGPFFQLYIVVNAVDGLDKGIYRLCHHCHMLHVHELGDMSRKLQMAYRQTAVNCASASLVCYLVVDYPAANEMLGNRSYRIVHMESGIIAQRLCVMSAAYGLAARCSDAYHMQGCQALLGLTPTSAFPLFQVIIGYEQPGASGGERYRMSTLL